MYLPVDQTMMAEGRVVRVGRPDEPKEDPDFYIRTIAATWGHLDLIKEWIPHHLEDRAKITDHVLIPAAMYGQLEVLKLGLEHGMRIWPKLQCQTCTSCSSFMLVYRYMWRL